MTVGDPGAAALRFVVDHHVRERAGGNDRSPPTSIPPTACELAGHRRAACTPTSPAAGRDRGARRCSRTSSATCCAASCSCSSSSPSSATCCCSSLHRSRDLRDSPRGAHPGALVVLAPSSPAWPLTGIAVDPVNLIVPPLLVGIGVDNGVYLAAAARQRGGVGTALRVRRPRHLHHLAHHHRRFRLSRLLHLSAARHPGPPDGDRCPLPGGTFCCRRCCTADGLPVRIADVLHAHARTERRSQLHVLAFDGRATRANGS